MIDFCPAETTEKERSALMLRLFSAQYRGDFWKLGSSFVLGTCVLTLPPPRAQKTKARNEGAMRECAQIVQGGSAIGAVRYKNCNQRKRE